MPIIPHTIFKEPSPAGSESASSARPVMEIAVFGSEGRVHEVIRRLRQSGEWCRIEHVADGDDVTNSDLERFDAALIVPEGSSDASVAATAGGLDAAIELFGRLGIGQVVLADDAAGPCGEGTVRLSTDAPTERLRGALTALAQWRTAMRTHARQLAGMHRLHQSLHKHFDEIDRELQLASRLQRDFLPRGVTKFGPIRFSTLYRPCTWVSGDIFDIFPLDESHVGFYLADAIGHGVAAGLLTMYIKHAIKPKRISSAGTELVRPSEVLSMLNDQLSAQDLPDSQFITGWYGVLNTQTLRLEYAIAGHPPPMLIDGGEFVRELHGEGSMLGLCQGQTYSDESVVLQPGQRVLLYSDGLEPALIAERRPAPALSALHPEARNLITAPSEALIRTLVTELDSQPGSLAHADDVSLLILDVES